jgi:hypothetical protein
MESTPDSGVEIKNEVTAPLLAPCLCSDTAAGSTPQLHNGSGMPTNAALNTGAKRPLPKCRATLSGLRNTRIKPAIASPSKMYTDASSKICQLARRVLTNKSTMMMAVFFLLSIPYS